MEQQQQLQQELRPCTIPDGERRGSETSSELMSIDQCGAIREMDDSQLVGAPVTASPAADVAEASMVVDVEVIDGARVVAEGSLWKRRRGRPPRTQGKTSTPSPPRQRKKKEEEDVCFICFDGGSLVLCDRRGCPKAYHPACIKRDESFFRSKAKWNCGWHICSSCRKASYYMCYTCTFSLCKGCTKDADYVCIRGNKGLCGTCMRTIMLIENTALGNNEMIQVDFDDKTSWEYLFKIYWVCLKADLSLTLAEISAAKNPWNRDEQSKAQNSWKVSGTIDPKGASCFNNFSRNLEANHFKKRKTMNQPTFLIEESTMRKGTVWATKELLEFVAHMKNGDTSMLTQFDVQALLLEYVKRNNLRDPHQKSQIICDSMLLSLFGKDRVGHFEMLKLLEYHFLVEEKSQSDHAVGAGITDVADAQVEATGSNVIQLMMGNERRRKTRKRNDKGSYSNPNPDEYAAIDVHNINLLYLKRSLMENLMDDAENFHEKVVGSFVRIRIFGGDQKQDMYRLVLVVGTSKVNESYKVGTRTTDVMLEIINLDKKELVSIDVISNQDFSEDECRRLRQSIKCGLINRLTVGEIQEKGMTFRAVKVSDWLEEEILRLNHLRDLASEKGRRKELRECVQKLELLKSPMERQRRLLEIPIVHADPKMDPSYESEKDYGELDVKKQGRQRNSCFRKKRPEVNSSLRVGDVWNEIGNRAQQDSATACEQSANVSPTFYADRDGTTWIHERLIESARVKEEAFGVNSLNAYEVGSTGLASGSRNNRLSILQPHLSTEGELSVNEIETDKHWLYQDPTGKIQGPFSMMQLRKWSICGLFPLDLRVWRVNEKQGNSILLTDAMVGRFSNEHLLPYNKYSMPPDIMFASNNTDNKCEHESRQNTDKTWVDRKKDDASIHCNGSSELMRRDGLASVSSSLTSAVDLAVFNDEQAQSSTQCPEFSKGNKAGPDQHHMYNLFPSSSTSANLSGDSLFQVREIHGDEKCAHASNFNGDPHKATVSQISATKSEKKQVDSEVHSSLSSGQNWRPLPIDSSSSRWDSTDSSKQNTNISDLPIPTPKQIHGYLQGQAAQNKQSILESGPTWSRASNSVVNGAQLPEVAGGWSGYSPNPTGPSVEKWDSNLLSLSLLKSTEGASDHAATLTTGSVQLMHSSSTHPTIDISSWQAMVLADDTVSDLLAEVEAMESLGGLPSPTSKLSCGMELTQGPDSDCFSPIEVFSPVPDQGKSDALSSTGDIHMPSQLAVTEECLKVSRFPSKPAETDAQLGASQLPPHLTVTEEPVRVFHMYSQSKVTEKPHVASQMPLHSTLTDEPLMLSQADVLESLKSFSEHSSPSSEVEGDAKHSDVSVNQWEAGTEIQPPASSTINRAEAGLDIKPPIPSIVRQWESDSDVQPSAPSVPEGSWGTAKGSANVSQVGVTQGSRNTVWGIGHETVQQNTNNTNSVISTGNSSSRVCQARHGGGDRLSGSKDQRNYFLGRDSGFGRDRSTWNKQPLFGVGNGGGGGGTHRPPPKGQRVCKFYELHGYCKKGASCSYLHP